VEVATVLALIDVLFLSFVIVQLPHFFGSYQHLLQPGTATFSEYARRGFFELCVVAGLVLPMLMGLHWLLRKEGGRAERVFRIAAGAMVGLVFVIIVSALHRMRLYQSAYGLTELRVYTTAFMFWLSAVFGWFCWTVLRGNRERFAFGALTAAVETVILLHVANPDALIVRVNAGRQQAPVSFDAMYATSLSADAVPALLARLDAMPADARCPAVDRLLSTWSGEGEDWRAWSLGRSRAVSAVRARRAELRAVCPGAEQAARAAVRVPVTQVVPTTTPTPTAVPPTTASGAAATPVTTGAPTASVPSPATTPALGDPPAAAGPMTPAPSSTSAANPSATIAPAPADVRGRP
jgi:hypothetical protein